MGIYLSQLKELFKITLLAFFKTNAIASPLYIYYIIVGSYKIAISLFLVSVVAALSGFVFYAVAIAFLMDTAHGRKRPGGFM